jgi:hypothetical protein
MKKSSSYLLLALLLGLSACEKEAPPLPVPPVDPDLVHIRKNSQLLLDDRFVDCAGTNVALQGSNRFLYADSPVYVLKRIQCPAPLKDIVVVITTQMTATYTLPNNGGTASTYDHAALTLYADALK